MLQRPVTSQTGRKRVATECAIRGCHRVIQARGWCSLHYRRWMRTGDPTKVLQRRSMPVPERFWASVQIAGPKDCWLWTGTRSSRGFCYFTIGRAMHSAKSVSWWLYHGDWPQGRVWQSCRRKSCVNPVHLEQRRLA